YTLGFFAELLRAQGEAGRMASRVQLPVLAVLAGQDRITDVGGAREVLARVPARVHTVVYTQAWHSVVAEAPARVVQDFAAFVAHTRRPPWRRTEAALPAGRQGERMP
ncbi:MAG: alpha/beta hydrolase, partial [Firmicutes bacterium]|nr:alpha/beta hydrolase [Bacillota bacterium]